MLGLIIFVLVFYFIGINNVVYHLSRINLFYYFLSIVTVFFTILCWSLRWNSFIKFNGYNVPTFGILKILFVGIFVNNLTPSGKMGGEPVRAYLLKKENKIPIERGFATIIADLTIEFLVSLIFVIISIFLATFFINLPFWLSFVLAIFLILSIICLGGLLGVYSDKIFISRIIIWFIRKIERIKPFEKKILEIYKSFQETFKKCFKNKRIFFTAIYYSILIKIFDVLKYILIFKALGYQIGLIEILIVSGVSVILMSIPATPGSLGIAEAGMISAFTLVGIPLYIATAAVFLERLIWFWGTSFIGMTLGLRYGIKISKMS